MFQLCHGWVSELLRELVRELAREPGVSTCERRVLQRVAKLWEAFTDQSLTKIYEDMHLPEGIEDSYI